MGNSADLVVVIIYSAAPVSVVPLLFPLFPGVAAVAGAPVALAVGTTVLHFDFHLDRLVKSLLQGALQIIGMGSELVAYLRIGYGETDDDLPLITADGDLGAAQS